jgi:hypothetical protein
MSTVQGSWNAIRGRARILRAFGGAPRDGREETHGIDSPRTENWPRKLVFISETCSRHLKVALAIRYQLALKSGGEEVQGAECFTPNLDRREHYPGSPGRRLS